MANLSNYFKTLVIISILFIISCAKKPEYDYVHKDAKLFHIKKSFDLDAEYLYVPMTMGTPRDVPEADPFFQGQPKIVKVGLQEKGLKVYQPDKDIRFKENELNNVPVFTIPGTYHAYKCATNNLGECTNREEEDNEMHWSKRPFFKPNLGNLQVQEINPLDLFTLNSNCYKKLILNL